jgi:hypothetical protein
VLASEFDEGLICHASREGLTVLNILDAFARFVVLRYRVGKNAGAAHDGADRHFAGDALNQFAIRLVDMAIQDRHEGSYFHVFDDQ